MAPLSRRHFLRTAGLAVAAGAAACSPTGVYPSSQHHSEGAMVPSLRPLPEAFSVPLPTPPVLDVTAPSPAAARAGTAVAQTALTIAETDLEIIPGTVTRMLTYNGTYPGPTIVGRRGQAVAVDVINKLPINQVVHLHGGVTPPAHDGYPTDMIAPHTTRRYEYPLDQPATMLWYHDHVADFTGPNVYAGLAGGFIVGDPAEAQWSFPDGERDLPLVIADRSFGPDAELLYPGVSLGDATSHTSSSMYPPAARVPDALGRLPGVQLPYIGGVLGDVVLVNGAPWPRCEVRGGVYRLRVLNGSNARRYDLRLDGDVDIVQIGSDGGLLPSPADLRGIVVAPGERVDVLVDFSRLAPDSTVTMRNDFATGSASQVMQFIVTGRATDRLDLPATFGAGELAADGPFGSTAVSVDTVRGMHFALAPRSQWWNVVNPGPEEWSINGVSWRDNTDLFTARLGTVEKWQITANQYHPVHAHLVHMAVPGPRARSGAQQMMWKDTLDLKPGGAMEAIVPVRGFAGRYVMHCHNLEHEDHMMMVPFSTTV